MTVDMRNQEPLSVDLQKYWGLFKRWWWLGLLLALIGGAFSYLFSAYQPKIYQAKGTILISHPQVTADFKSTFSNESIAKTYSRLMVQQPTLDGVIRKLGLDLSVNQLQRNLKVNVIPDTQLLELTIEDQDPNRAPQIVNTIGEVFAEQNTQLQASRYQEMKINLETQMENIDQQIEETNQALANITEKNVNPQEDILQTKLTTYREIYQSLLRQTIESETIPAQESVLGDSSRVIEEQLAILDEKITEINQEMTAVGFYDPQYDLLQTRLNAYKDLYKSLVQDLALEEMNQVLSQEPASPTDSEEISAQLETISARIQETTRELEEVGGKVNNGSQQDRLESNLVLYQQTYANLVQSYEEIRLAEVQNTISVDLVQPAVVPGEPIRPLVKQDTMLGAIVGVFLAAGIVFLLEVLDDTIKTPEDVARFMNLPVLGVIFKHESEGLITVRQPRSPDSEAFRSIRTNLLFASVDYPLKSLLVTSPSPEDGKTTVVANLGAVFAQGNHQVMLLDADMRRPKLHKYLDLSNRQGLSTSFQKSDQDGLIQSTKVEGLRLMSSGPLPPNPSELLGSETMINLLRHAVEQNDLVIMDTPPVSLVTDASVLAHQADGVLVIVKPGVTKRAACQRTVDQLRNVGANILGVVLNEVEPRQTNYYYSYNGYYYYTDDAAYYGATKEEEVA